eukprot:8223802-Karenia_brevis.AAC.1
MRALLAVGHYGNGVSEVTAWSDSEIVADGYTKGKATLQCHSCSGRNNPDKKIKSHTIDEAIVAREQQAGNWLVDYFAEAGAQGVPADTK